MKPGRFSRGERILALCTGNLCRSPFAEFYLRARSEEGGWGLRVRSRGTHGLKGGGATEEALLVAAEFGLDLGPHVARALGLADLEWADRVLAMTAIHERTMEPMLLSLEDPPGIHVLDIEDPYGMEIDFYRRCFTRITERLEAFLPDSPPV